jgi:hypothetical protein
VVNNYKKFKLKKPLMVEIKYVMSEEAQDKLIQFVSDYERTRDKRNPGSPNFNDQHAKIQQQVSFLVTSESRLGKKEQRTGWCACLKKNLRIYRTDSHKEITSKICPQHE